MTHKKKFMTITYGCQMNRHDTEKVAYQLESMGLVETKDEHEAHLILILTCSVREKAESKVFGKLGELKTLKKRRPNLIIGIGGCMTQQKELAKRVRSTYPHVDLIFGTHNLHHLKELLSEAFEAERPVMEILEREEGVVSLPFTREKQYASWVSISYGCSNFCSYCIVPYVRGQERSRPFHEICQEVEELVADGVKEITLLGQNVNSYGKECKERDFAGLLKALDGIPGLSRIRFTTSHPRDFSSSIIDAIASLESVCEHIHLPLQSGSTRILEKMNRGYTSREYRRLVEEMREKIDNVSITSDIIVGFPGEEERDFLETLEMVERVRYASLFTFLYSPRKHTRAALLEDTTPDAIKKERFQRLLHLQNRITLEENERYRDQVVEVLVEGESKKDPSMQMGRTRTNRVVIFPRDEDLEGELVEVKIHEVQTWSLFGSIKKTS